MKNKKLNYFRLILQWSVLILILHEIFRPFVDSSYLTDVEAYCPFGGLQALSTYLITDTLACSMTTLQIFMGLALLTAAFIFSKLFCGYLCPLGTITEWFGKYGKKLKLRFTITGISDRILRIFKYALLFITFYFTIGASELFCKKFDPYYACATGFSSDVVVLYALIAIAILVIGSFFITQGWCKYLCPLSAATNIFANFIMFASVTAVYLALTLIFKIKISWVVLLIAYTGLGFLMEAFFARLWIFPLFKVTRNPDTCTLCRKCDKVCPMAIKVSESGRVNHIDCHLCGDCVVKCPEKGVLKINRKSMLWLPSVVIALLLAAGIFFSSKVEVPTINMMWGTPQQIENAKVVTLENMKSIKCYGSSVSFAEQIKNVKGVVGVKTFVKHHTVEVFYDKSLTDAETVKKAVFIPSKIFIASPDSFKVSKISLKIQNYFDAYDEALLSELLSQQKGIFGFTTSYGEPVDAVIFCNPELFTPEKIKSLIESDEISIDDNGEITKEKLKFEVPSIAKSFEKISTSDFLRIFVPEHEATFNKYETYTSVQLALFEAEISNFSASMQDQLNYLVSHVSGNKFIVHVYTKYSESSTMLYVEYVKDKTTETEVKSMVTAKEFDVMYSDGSTEKIPNELTFVLK